MNPISTNPFSSIYAPASTQGTTPTLPTQPVANEEGGGFQAVLRNAIDQVEQMHTDAQQQSTQLATGDRQDVHNVMIAVEKADVAFQLMMQVRNKIVNAYQEVSKMQF
jgi:flagellar hook-basal body complex protein FliE